MPINDSKCKLYLPMNLTFEDYSKGASEEHIPTVNGATIVGLQGQFLNNQYVSFPDSEDWNFEDLDFEIGFDVTFNSIPGYGEACSIFSQGNFLCRQTYDTLLGEQVLVFHIPPEPTDEIIWTPIIHTPYNIKISKINDYLDIYIDEISQCHHSYRDFVMSIITADFNIGKSGTGYWLNGFLDNFYIIKGTQVPPFNININDVWKEGTPYINIEDDWKTVKSLKVAIGENIDLYTKKDVELFTYKDIELSSNKRLWKQVI